ncbi:MAG TPA: hypothetical protein PK514_06405 [Spirochaetota bacterium]|nr:hypothetical protein [Spirochaetota bacterium]
MKRLVIIFMIISPACGDMSFFIRDDLKVTGNGKILIGDFSSRDMSYDPFLADELRDRLRFTLFSNGYDVQIVEDDVDKKRLNHTSDIAALCNSNGCDVFITGVVSRKEVISITDRKVYLSVSFVIMDRNGKVKGEGSYIDCNVDAPEFIKDAAESFVSEFTKQVRGE